MAKIKEQTDFLQLIENLITGVFICTTREIIYANNYVYQLLGYKSDEPLYWDEILHSDYKEVCVERLETVINHKLSVEPMEQRLVKKDGTIIHVEIFASPYIQGDHTMAQVQMQDITKRKKFEQDYVASEQHYQLISHHTSDIVVEFGLSDLRITFCNTGSRISA